MAARSIGSGTISFGLVSIPIKLFTATSPQNVSFNQLHKKCGSRLKQQLLCPVDNEVVPRTDIVKGFEYTKDRYVQFSDEELKKLEAERTDRLDIMEFVPADSVDFIYIEKTYYLGPDKGGDRAYKLLSDAMTRMNRVAVGRFGTRGKEQLVLLRPYRGGLVVHHVFYADEVRSFDDVDRPGEVEFKPVEAELADKLIEQLSSDGFKPEQYHDEYRDRVTAAVEQKAAGQEISVAPEQPQAQIIDLFEALKRSLSTETAKGEEKKPEVKKAAPKRDAKKKEATG
ncbi:MAG: Ku protein [Polyangiaceae bacterium]|nr:Ku protein [Polyangiaceae bacterium]